MARVIPARGTRPLKATCAQCRDQVTLPPAAVTVVVNKLDVDRSRVQFTCELGHTTDRPAGFPIVKALVGAGVRIEVIDQDLVDAEAAAFLEWLDGPGPLGFDAARERLKFGGQS